ncbi:hypothetical protein DX933_08980 [Ornithinibacillus gellani]|uniref:hypothetical protein n=1 Tax=Ornithinibacillus gellani TaxID=2293253 RepID=UPI000F49F360|nr:hypothetical protein [Ornithinibacillus gellani]TQS74891.1 hypothetical protein DX933_08980 [Ornithinibacillus gellani]
MVTAVLSIGAVLAAVMVVIGLVLAKASSKSVYMPYVPGMIVFVGGIVLIVVAAIAGKIEILGAGLGGWGIACLFASAFGFIITSIVDAYSSPAA